MFSFQLVNVDSLKKIELLQIIDSYNITSANRNPFGSFRMFCVQILDVDTNVRSLHPLGPAASHFCDLASCFMHNNNLLDVSQDRKDLALTIVPQYTHKFLSIFYVDPSTSLQDIATYN